MSKKDDRGVGGWYPARKGWCLRLVVVLVLIGISIFSPTAGVEIVAAQSDGQPKLHVVRWGETISSIAQTYGVAAQAIVEANDLAEDGNNIFAGQQLIIPGQYAETSSTSLDSSTDQVYIVQQGDTLYSISIRYEVSVDVLLEANGMSSGRELLSGMRLLIPGSLTADEVRAQSSAPDETGAEIYIVIPGDNLSLIAERYGVSISSIITENNILNPSAIFAGQALRIPGAASAGPTGYSPAEASVTHTVKAGETLHGVAARYGVSVWVIVQANSITNPSLLEVGRKLTIPDANSLTPAQTESEETTPASTKAVVVDISDQRTYVYENGTLLWAFVVSTGLPGADTWRGEFHVQNKIRNAYADTWNLRMPYWIGFYWAGPLQNGFHALPILGNGTRLWEGLLGQPASYGCVILNENDAALLYNWVEVGVPVTVRD